MGHVHRSSFFGFLFSVNHVRGGFGYRIYRCKYCGKRIQLVKSQRKKYNWLSAVPPVFMLLFIIEKYINSDTTSLPLYIVISYGVIYIALCMLTFYFAYFLAKFELYESNVK